ncbi:MAG: hypothetical protein HY704_12305 [Gemmatimonadetes bacterium]|nr:hypothetical protein [Gemmatimonadota bacterium]
MAEIEHVFQAGKSLRPGQPIPGCHCELCVPEAAESTSTEHCDPSGRRFSHEEIRRARQTPILVVLERLQLSEELEYVAGDEWRLRCPLHDEQTPSFFVNAERNLWHCFGCDAGGNSLDLVMAVLGLSFAPAVRWALRRVPTDREPSRITPLARSGWGGAFRGGEVGRA